MWAEVNYFGTEEPLFYTRIINESKMVIDEVDDASLFDFM